MGSGAAQAGVSRGQGEEMGSEVCRRSVPAGHTAHGEGRRFQADITGVPVGKQCPPPRVRMGLE